MEITKLEETKKWIGGFESNRDGVKRTFGIKLVVHNSNGGYIEDEYKFEIGEDGFLTIWDGRINFMTVAPEAADTLRQFLHEWLGAK